MKLLGLIGHPLSHSFSPSYFARKFEEQGIQGWAYRAFPLPDIQEFPFLWTQHPGLVGLNVTIPHKQAVIPFLNQISPAAQAIGAVNTIRKVDGQLVGYNTDVLGFATGLDELLQGAKIHRALILGTGGASRAVAYVLAQRDIPHQKVSRKGAKGTLSYAELDETLISEHPLIVNTTPLGTYPNISNCPDIPYSAISPKHYLYDLVYNPAKTLFLEKGIQQGASTINGWPMLKGQAEAAWRIWTETTDENT